MRLNPSGRRQGPPWVLGAGCLVVVIALAGCTGVASGASGGTSFTQFTFALPAAPISLDIPKDFDGNTMQIMGLVTEKLERISLTGQLSPALATRVAEPNGTTLVYTIRGGVKFPDGSPLTANDVVWSLGHMTDAGSGAQTAGNAGTFDSVTATGPLQVTVKLTRPDPGARANLTVIGFIQQAAFGQAHPQDLGSASAVPIGTGPYHPNRHG